MLNSGQFLCCHQQVCGQNSAQVICRRLLQIAELSQTEWGRVGRDACCVCLGEQSPSDQLNNDVLASLLVSLAHEIITAGGMEDCSVDRAQRLMAVGASGLRVWTRPATRIVRLQRRDHAVADFLPPECDVLLNLTSGLDGLPAALESLRNQVGCKLTLHLVAFRENEKIIHSGPYSPCDVHLHWTAVYLSELEALQKIIPECASEYVGIQTCTAVSEPSRFADALAQLQFHGGEFLATAVNDAGQTVHTAASPEQIPSTLPVETLVLRKSSFIDAYSLGGAKFQSSEAFVRETVREGRKYLLSARTTVRRSQLREPFTVEESTTPQINRDLSTSATVVSVPEAPDIGEPVACDVVLPFRDQFDYVQQAIESILAQRNCQIVLHLIDDASRQSTTDFFRRWKEFPQIRCYQNLENLSQYTSFNNVIPYLETDFVAIQDGDDVSLPDRIVRAVDSLRLSHADIFTAALEQFGEVVERHSQVPVSEVKFRSVPTAARIDSKLPQKSRLCFANNATVVMRVTKFCELGGFTDYGSAVVNRAALDTEFYLRAYLSGQARFFVSRHLAVRYRRHTASATQCEETGFGSSIRTRNREELKRRRTIYLRGNFDPREFGALGRYQHLTQPLE